MVLEAAGRSHAAIGSDFVLLSIVSDTIDRLSLVWGEFGYLVDVCPSANGG